MRWKGGRRSTNVEDQRGRRMRGGRAFKGGIGTIVIALALAYFLGIDPQVLLQLQQEQRPVRGVKIVERTKLLISKHTGIGSANLSRIPSMRCLKFDLMKIITHLQKKS